ncbi:MAG: DegT/DnrJ/EryC1/StrS family aminotransferase [Acidimicrobiia bacterium]
MIPISTYKTTPETEDLVLQVLRSGQLAQGPMVRELEDLSVEMSGAEHAVAFSNGTVTLIAALVAHGIGPGDEVITSPFTFVATLNAILYTGATAVFTDIDPQTYCIDPAGVEAAITKNTKAIMPVHIFGQSADMTSICKIANKHSLAIIEDAAQAHGALWNGQGVGSFGTGSFSFYTTKNVGSGEGGMVTTNNSDIAHTLRLLRNQGMEERYKYERVGWNFRLTDLQAAVAIPQMKSLDESNKRRNLTAQMYNEAFASCDDLIIPFVREEAYSVWHQYSLRVKDPSKRELIMESLTDAGIGNGVYYPRPVFEYDPYMNNEKVKISSCDVTRKVCESVFSIPIHHYLNENDVDLIIKSVTEITS